MAQRVAAVRCSQGPKGGEEFASGPRNELLLGIGAHLNQRDVSEPCALKLANAGHVPIDVGTAGHLGGYVILAYRVRYLVE